MITNEELKEYLVDLGRRIAQERKIKGFSQDDLWYHADLSRRTINKVELGQVEAKIGTLMKISKALDIPLEKLVKV